MASERTKCVVEGDALLPCWALARADDDGRKGLRSRQIVDLRTGTITSTLVAIHSGDFVKKGIVANYCPFCGADIASHLTKRPSDTTTAREAPHD